MSQFTAGDIVRIKSEQAESFKLPVRKYAEEKRLAKVIAVWTGEWFGRQNVKVAFINKKTGLPMDREFTLQQKDLEKMGPL